MLSFDDRIREKFANVVRRREDMHDYQRVAHRFMLDNPFSLLVLDLGLGKSVTSLTVIADLLSEFATDKVLVVGPLRVATRTWPDEIATWEHTAPFNYVVLREDDDDPRLKVARAAGRADARRRGLGPEAIQKAAQSFEQEQRERIRRELANHRASIHIINKERLAWLVETHGRRWPYRTVIVDECFVAGTPVATPAGDRPIESIRAGDLVVTPYGNLPVLRTLKKTTRSLVRLTLTDGRTVVCTPEHKFLTNEGWCNAGNTRGKEVYSQQKEGGAHVPALWKALLDGETEDEVLHKIVRQVSPVGHETGLYAHADTRISPDTGHASRLEQGETLERGREGETARKRSNSTGQFSRSPRWERNRDDQARNVDLESPRAGVGSRVRDTCRRANTWVSDMLQSGLRLAGETSCLGSGRVKPQLTRAPSTGQEEGRKTRRTWVASVENIELGREQDVYDITVKGAPFYYANDCLVHNCSMFRSHATDVFKSLAKVRNTPGLIERMHLLTATPATESYLSLFPQTYLLDGGERFGKGITKFRDTYFTYNKYSMKYKLRPGAEEEILAKIADICLVMKAEDYLDIEKPVFVPRRVHLTPVQMDLYQTMEREFIVTLPDGTEIEAETAAALSQKLLQMSSGTLYETYLDQDLDTDDMKKVRRVHSIHDHKLDELEQIVEEAQGSPLLVAYHHKSSLDRLKKRFPKAVVMDRAAKCVKAWNAGKIPMLLIHPQSGGHGLNLQHGGHNVVFFDLPWSLELYLQLIGRLARQGQKHVVVVHLLIAAGTIDEVVYGALNEKSDAQEKMFVMLKRLIRKARIKSSL